MVVRRSETGTLAVEIAWLRAAELPKLTRIEEMLAGGTSEPAPAATATAIAPAARPAPAPRPVAAAPPPRPQPVEARPPAAAPKTEAPAPASAPAAGRPRDPVNAYREEVAKRKQNLGGFLDAAETILYENGGVTIQYPVGDTYLRGRLEANRAILEEAAVVVWGTGTRAAIMESRNAPPAAPREEKRPAGSQGIEKNSAVQAVLEIFKGSQIEAVQEHGSPTED
jgi:hypothetical protein